MTNTKQNKKLKKRPIVPNTSFTQEDVRSDGIVNDRMSAYFFICSAAIISVVGILTLLMTFK